MEITKEQVDHIFKQCKNTEEALIDLYKLILPDWEQIKTSKGFPLIGKDGWLYICECFIRLSKPTNNGFPELWLNKGFDSSDYLPMWTVDLNHFYPTYENKPDEPASVLLDRIKAEREAMKPKKKITRKRRAKAVL